jgi:hypothetical protein
VIDERLGRHSTSALTVLIPGVLVLAVFIYSFENPGGGRESMLHRAVFAIPSVAALALGLLNGEGLVRSLLRAALAALLIIAWYLLLLLPYAAFCSAARGASCM